LNKKIAYILKTTGTIFLQFYMVTYFSCFCMSPASPFFLDGGGNAQIRKKEFIIIIMMIIINNSSYYRECKVKRLLHLK